jgi:TatD DNase family protein
MVYCDAHIHIQNCSDISFLENNKYFACSSTHSKKEFEKLCDIETQLLNSIKDLSQIKIYKSFGIHPQMATSNDITKYYSFLESLLALHTIDAIGEIGFDLFSEEFKQTFKQQEAIWYQQLELAQKNGKPIIIHCRKAMSFLFRDTRLLKQLPAVIMHSFSGSVTEANSFLHRGINAYFSCGKQILNNNKQALKCVTAIEKEHLLLETDAPYQILKNEKETYPSDIIRVYKKASDLRGISVCELTKQLEKNFINCFQGL